MKKFFVIILILLLILAGAGVAFLLTLDVDKYRPQIVRQLESAIQKPVKLEKIRFGWRGGLALELQGLAILKSQSNPAVLVRLDSAKAVLTLMPLLMRQIQIATVYLDHPYVNLIKRPDGAIEGLQEKPRPAPPAAGSKSASPSAAAPAAALSFLADKIKMEDGEILFRDEFLKEPMEIHLHAIDGEWGHVTINEPVDFVIKLAAFSQRQNLQVSGRFKISPAQRTQAIEDVRGTLDLATLEQAELAKINPAFSKSAVQFPLEGLLEFSIDSIKINPQGIQKVVAEIHLKNGRARIPSLKAPFENISADILASQENIKIQNLSGQLGGGNFQAQVDVQMKTPSQLAGLFKGEIKNVRLENILNPPIVPGSPEFNGTLAAKWEGGWAGSQPESIMASLNAEGNVQVTDAVIKNLNILKEVFRKLSLIPGLSSKLGERLPPDYKQKFETSHTQLENSEFPVIVKGGIASVPRFVVASESFQLQGTANYILLSQSLFSQAMISVEPGLSDALVHSVNELQYLTNAEGSLVIPLTIQGSGGKVSVVPDLQYIASKLAVQKTQQVLSDLLKKQTGAADSKTTNPSPGASPAPQGGLLGQWLGGQSADGTSGTKKKMPKASQILGALLESAREPQASSQ